jgi:hypothetical protein
VRSSRGRPDLGPGIRAKSQKKPNNTDGTEESPHEFNGSQNPCQVEVGFDFGDGGGVAAEPDSLAAEDL